MPSSTSRQVDAILTLAALCAPRSVLDVGAGNGRYGFLLRDILDPLHLPEQWSVRIEGVEVFEAYLTPVHRYVYDAVHVGTAGDVLPSIPDGAFDLALLLDVIEHMPQDEGHELLTHLRRVATSVIIATPQTWIEQGAVHGDPFEEHQSLWSARDFAGSQVVPNDVQVIAFYTRDDASRERVSAWLLRQKIKAAVPPILHPLLFRAYTSPRLRR